MSYFLPLHIHLNECSRGGGVVSWISDPAKKTMPRLKTIIVNIICLLLLIIVCSALRRPFFSYSILSRASYFLVLIFPHHNKRLLIEIIHYYFLSILNSNSSAICTLHTGRFGLNLYQSPRNIFFAKIWHCMVPMTLQDTIKPMRYWKRPTKAEKVILKAGESKNGKIMFFFAFCDHLVTKIKG